MLGGSTCLYAKVLKAASASLRIDDRPWRRPRNYKLTRPSCFSRHLSLEHSKPVTELPKVPQNIRPWRPILSISGTKTPVDILGGGQGQKRGAAIPAPRREPEVESKQCPRDRQMPHGWNATRGIRGGEKLRLRHCLTKRLGGKRHGPQPDSRCVEDRI